MTLIDMMDRESPAMKTAWTFLVAAILALWPDRDTEIRVLSRTGRRSMEVGAFLHRHGYRNVYVVDDGAPGWAKKGFPLAAGER
jgi:rhodanese-related sulfurtransferase